MLFFRGYNKKPSSSQQLNHTPHQETISSELMDNIEEIQSIFYSTPDLIVRYLVIKQTQSQAALVYLSGITDTKMIFNHVLNPLLFEAYKGESENDLKVSLGHIRETNTWPQIESAILNGECVLFEDKCTEAFIYDTPSFPKRSIEDTSIESSLTGAHVGFTETGGENVALIRKHIHNRELKIKEMTVGKRGKLNLSILYLADVANPEVLKELENRIKKVEVDSVINAGALAEYIEDNPYTPFPQLLLTRTS
ncbi:spore germination protein [Niallia oryzisoli]|uniref:Spore germination protein n=1 Tax=Niallia oryzisoli TaxID=1737571 RepID=A0ABZ2CLY9_9BACI